MLTVTIFVILYKLKDEYELVWAGICMSLHVGTWLQM